MVGMYPGMTTPYMGYPQTSYGGGMMPSPYGGSPYGGGMQTDNSMQTFSFCMAIIQPLMNFLFSVMNQQPQSSSGCGNTGSSGSSGNTGGTDGSSGTDNSDNTTPPKNPTSNTEALQILSDYSDQIPGKNGKVTLKDLKKLAQGTSEDGSDVPDAVKSAAQMLSDNPELYNLLCLKSGNDPKKGIDKDVFSDEKWQDFEDHVDLDSLETFDKGSSGDKDAIKKLKDKAADIAHLTGGSSSTDITIDDLKQIALGKAGHGLDDPELQAAALRVLSSQDLKDELDIYDDTDTNTPGNNTTPDSFQSNAFQEWLTANP